MKLKGSKKGKFQNILFFWFIALNENYKIVFTIITLNDSVIAYYIMIYRFLSLYMNNYGSRIPKILRKLYLLISAFVHPSKVTNDGLRCRLGWWTISFLHTFFSYKFGAYGFDKTLYNLEIWKKSSLQYLLFQLLR